MEGEYTLTPEQIQALNNGMVYLDVHTTRYRGGELRGILMPM
ncbi:CHRD domain-containing protein [Nodosilinea sp. P-1105]|nr:CHRD domain-containing protein [Nodosilinea sp. P-1105]NMF85393.1 CHRD domain-containing protein [Nodosilinea sp. P-1105]